MFEDDEMELTTEEMKPNVDRLIYKIEQCTDYQCLYALEEEFNKAGLTVQATPKNRMILCKLRNGRPLAESVVDDYIFIGGLDGMSNEPSDRTVSKISDFVRTNAGSAGKVQNCARVWRNGLRMYEATISVMNEDVQHIAGDLIFE
ncbi:MAG: hypothetical protein Q8K86_00170 [Candidatus Nanopelagicaceae bacterium]|nr:hypothetical protein [Candidatus Nanopelagicaceae bacterium]